MKTLLLGIALLLSGVLTAQTIDNPSFKARSGSITNITRIERTPETTKLFIHAIFRPHWWIKEEGDSYLVDAATGTKYPFQKAEGIELHKETYMPDSGEMDYILYFNPLPKETQSFHLLSPTDREGNTYDISLTKQNKEKQPLLETIKGNWHRADISNNWEYGVYDSVTIAHNRIYTHEGIRKKGKNIELTIKNEKDGIQGILTFTPQKDGNYAIAMNNANKYLYTKQKSAIQACTAEKDFTQFFRKDTSYIQGYINGYDPRLGFETGLIYMANVITREDYPTVINIHPNGTFDAKLALNYPVENNLYLNDANIPFYIGPGQTLTLYINWEDILARNRARDHNYPIKSTVYMGPTAELSQMYAELQKLITYPYNKLSKAQKELTPNQFKEQIQEVYTQWDQRGDSLSRIYNSDKATHLLKNKIAVEKGRTLLDFLMSRDYYAEQDTANQVLKVKADLSFYDFLKSFPLNDETILADSQSDIFTNRFEFMDPLREAIYGKGIEQSDSATITYPSKTLLTFLKENGVTLTPEQEAIRIKEDKLVGKTVKVPLKEAMKNINIVLPLYSANKELIQEHEDKYIRKGPAVPEPEVSEEEQFQQFLTEEEQRRMKGDSLIQLLGGQPKSFLWQTSLLRNVKNKLGDYTREKAQAYIQNLNSYLTYPILVDEANCLLETLHPQNATANYQLPECKATTIFRNIIKAHQGKVLFVDFWATSCGPCRSGIEHTANLRKEYKNHPEFQFIYITSEEASPESAYNSYVEKNLQGEASYRVSENEFNYLRELFKFNGIPHYELVQKGGSIAVKSPGTYELERYLRERFNQSDK